MDLDEACSVVGMSHCQYPSAATDISQTISTKSVWNCLSILLTKTLFLGKCLAALASI